MTKKLLLPFFLLLCAFSVHAQLNNSWIDYNKTYYKFKIAADNICRIPQAALSSAGIGSVNADNFQLWKNGQQVRLYTSVSGAPLGAADFIEFMGEMNDGKADKELYKLPQFQLADRYSLETDTSVYFFTVNPGGPNLRYAAAPNPAPAGSAVPDAYFMRSIDLYYRAQQNRGYAADLNEYVYSSSYDNGEGFTTGDITATSGTPGPGTYTENITGLNVYTSGPSNSLSVRGKFFGNSANSTGIISFKIFNNEVYTTVRSGITEAIANVTNLPLSYLQNPANATLTVTNTTTNPLNDRLVIATMGITYPATFNFNNLKSFSFDLAASATGNYLLIDNFNYGTVAPVLYDISSGNRYIGDISTPGKVKFVLPPSATSVRKFILNNAEPANINAVNSLSPKTFINYNTAGTRGDYIIISHPLLFNDGSGANKVDEYRAYRSSVNGGGFNAKIYDINELTDQFAFGIKKHPAAVRDFVRFMDQQYPVKPKFIFIIGRGMTYLDQRSQEANPLSETLGMVTTFGWPASDILLVSQPGTAVPITPVGRLGAVTGTEVGIYLQKVIQYEQVQRTPSPLIADKAWMKNVMQVGGGADQIQGNDFDALLEEYARIVRDTLFGGKVERFSKTSSASVQQASSTRITQLFQEGLSFIQYFGHSSASVFAFNLSDPNLYNNTGKYPFFNVSGCTAGNYYTFDPQRLAGTNLTLSEKYIFAPQKGSIGFLSDTHFGVVPFLHTYNLRFHQEFSLLRYGQSVGDQIKSSLNALGGINPALDFLTRIHLEEINLHGDPAIKINNFPKPDFVIEDQSIVISPNIISVADASFNVKVQMKNIGRAVNDSMRIYVKRLLPNATVPVTIIDSLIPAIKNTDSLNLTIPINPTTDKGLNKLIVELDYTNRIPELFETNNKITKDFFIFEDELKPVYPYNLSIVNQQNIAFTASTSNPLVSIRPFIMELDTTELFNSAFKKTYNVTSVGGAITFNASNVTFTDGKVYYWRTATVPNSGNYIWNTSSFIYLNAGGPGYNMSHYYQFTQNKFDQIQLDADRIFRFTPQTVSYIVKTGIYPYIQFDDQISISNNGFIEQNGLAGPLSNNYNAIRFYIIDSITLKALKNQVVGSGGQYGSYKPEAVNATQIPGYFQFDISTPAARNVVRDFINNNISSGNVIIVSNGGGSNTHFVSEWQSDPGPNMYTALLALGFTGINQITSDVPFVFATRKGSGGVVLAQHVGNTPSEFISESFPIVGTQFNGSITSPAFGPVRQWNSFHWRGNALEAAPNDRTSMEIYGINFSGVETLLTTVNPAQDTSLSWVNAVNYPFIKLKMLNGDSVTGTPYQLGYWRLNAELAPEGAVAPNIKFTLKDTVEIGEPIAFSVAFKNISDYNFDKLMKITLKIKTANNFDSIINLPPGKILIAGDTIIASYTIPSQNYEGKNTLFLEFNPDNDQLEQYHFNNILFKDFFVRSDKFNPLLDVTFDGVHILNRDIVSSKPNILIKLKDENRFLALKDTALLKVQLRYPDQSLHNYFFNSDTMRFIPANLSGGQNTASIEFRPYLPEDGEYELIVSGKDASGNAAGELNYRIVFSVINKPMISELLNYPNPFTTSTAFVFTLTGSQIPQNLRIQVLTITGKIVREITKSELGPVHIGRNITEFKWDGTDTYGQKLANGVYLYRVITNLNGKSLDKYKAEGDNTDKYFNKGYGKMYLMR